MAELLSHVLIVYVVLTIVSWRIEWLDASWIAVGMIGGIIPDLDRIGLFVPAEMIRDLLGVPFRWGAIHTIGGVTLASGGGAMVFSQARSRAFLVLFSGGVIHLLTDALKQYADGRAAQWLYPITAYRHPTPGLYVSSDVRVLAVVLVATGIVYFVDRIVVDASE